MTIEIVERARAMHALAASECEADYNALLLEMANEIERLGALNERLSSLIVGVCEDNERLIREIARLRAALRWYASARVSTIHPDHPGHCDDGYLARRELEGK